MEFEEYWRKRKIVVEEDFIATETKEDVKQIIDSTNDVVIFPGRVQPPHLGHAQLISKMKKDYPNAKPYIILVKGEKSSQDLEKNPFNQNEQIELLRKVAPGLDVDIFKNGFIPDIVREFSDKGLNVRAVYAGPDRAPTYVKQLQDAGYPGVDVVGVHERFVPISPLSEKYNGRELSASLVRDIILNNDYNDFQKVTSGYNETDFKIMQDTIRNAKDKVNKDKAKKAAEADVKRLQGKLQNFIKEINTARTTEQEQKFQAQKSQLETELISAKQKAGIKEEKPAEQPAASSATEPTTPV